MNRDDEKRAWSRIAGHVFAASMQGLVVALLVLAVSTDHLRVRGRR
jgi:hypothetical protein